MDIFLIYNYYLLYYLILFKLKIIINERLFRGVSIVKNL